MDRRQKKTRAAVFRAFTELLEKMNYSDITVQDIIDTADIGRSTFYAHFETKDELLKAMCTDIFEHIFSDGITSEPTHNFAGHDSFRERITHLLYHLQERRQSIRGIFSGECGEVFMRYFKEYLTEMFGSRLTDTGSIPLEYRLNHIMSSFAETVRWWLTGHNNYTPEEISRFFFESVEI